MNTEQVVNNTVIPEVHAINTPIISWPEGTVENKREDGVPLFGNNLSEAARAIRKIIGK